MSYTDMDAANARIEQLEQERYLIGRGCPADDVDFYHTKISRLVAEGQTFADAADEYISRNGFVNSRQPQYIAVDMSAGFNGSAPGRVPVNMSDAIRRAVWNKR